MEWGSARNTDALPSAPMRRVPDGAYRSIIPYPRRKVARMAIRKCKLTGANWNARRLTTAQWNSWATRVRERLEDGKTVEELCLELKVAWKTVSVLVVLDLLKTRRRLWGYYLDGDPDSVASVIRKGTPNE